MSRPANHDHAPRMLLPACCFRSGEVLYQNARSRAYMGYLSSHAGSTAAGPPSKHALHGASSIGPQGLHAGHVPHATDALSTMGSHVAPMLLTSASDPHGLAHGCGNSNADAHGGVSGWVVLEALLDHVHSARNDDDGGGCMEEMCKGVGEGMQAPRTAYDAMLSALMSGQVGDMHACMLNIYGWCMELWRRTNRSPWLQCQKPPSSFPTKALQPVSHVSISACRCTMHWCKCRPS